MAARVATPINTTTVPPTRATASQSVSVARGDARHHFEPHSRRPQRVRLLAAAREDERVAAFEAHDLLAGLAALDQQRVDVGLVHRRAARRLADADPLRIRREVEQSGDRETVVDHHVGAGQHLGAAKRQERRIARSGADEIDGHRVLHGAPSGSSAAAASRSAPPECCSR
jgi:hypothetical protein